MFNDFCPVELKELVIPKKIGFDRQTGGQIRLWKTTQILMHVTLGIKYDSHLTGVFHILLK